MTVCPLCQAAADFAQLDGACKHFKCSACGDFLLWRAAEVWLRGASQQAHERYSAEVRKTTDPTAIYVIRHSRPDEAPAEFVGEVQERSAALTAR